MFGAERLSRNNEKGGVLRKGGMEKTKISMLVSNRLILRSHTPFSQTPPLGSGDSHPPP